MLARNFGTLIQPLGTFILLDLVVQAGRSMCDLKHWLFLIDMNEPLGLIPDFSQSARGNLWTSYIVSMLKTTLSSAPLHFPSVQCSIRFDIVLNIPMDMLVPQYQFLNRDNINEGKWISCYLMAKFAWYYLMTKLFEKFILCIHSPFLVR